MCVATDNIGGLVCPEWIAVEARNDVKPRSARRQETFAKMNAYFAHRFEAVRHKGRTDDQQARLALGQQLFGVRIGKRLYPVLRQARLKGGHAFIGGDTCLSGQQTCRGKTLSLVAVATLSVVVSRTSTHST